MDKWRGNRRGLEQIPVPIRVLPKARRDARGVGIRLIIDDCLIPSTTGALAAHLEHRVEATQDGAFSLVMGGQS